MACSWADPSARRPWARPDRRRSPGGPARHAPPWPTASPPPPPRGYRKTTGCHRAEAQRHGLGLYLTSADARDNDPGFLHLVGQLSMLLATLPRCNGLTAANCGRLRISQRRPSPLALRRALCRTCSAPTT